MNDVIKETRKKMDALLKQRREELDRCQSEIDTARGNITTADLELREATEALDQKKYEDAKKRKEKANTTIEMYTARIKMIRNCELISETDSDEVIDDLLAYEHEIAKEYDARVREIVETLKTLTEDYRGEVSSTEALIVEWTARVHPNYRSSSKTYADGTNRGEKPTRVRISQYSGSPLSNQTKEFIKAVKTAPDDTRLSLLGDTH